MTLFDFKNDPFKKAIVASIVMHLLLMLSFMIKSNYRSKPLIDISQAISVNMADFNPKAIADRPSEAGTPNQEEVVVQEKVEKVSPKSEKPKVKEEVVKKLPKPEEKALDLSKAKNKQKAALDKIKKMSALEKIKDDVTKESQTMKIKGKIRGGGFRVIAAGTSLSGLDKLEAAEYMRLLDVGIKQVWTLPQWLANKNLRAQILVKFDVSGEIIGTPQVIQSSGNSTYDGYCLQAVTKAAPFPKVPEKFSDKFKIDGLVIGFPE